MGRGRFFGDRVLGYAYVEDGFYPNKEHLLVSYNREFSSGTLVHQKDGNLRDVSPLLSPNGIS